MIKLQWIMQHFKGGALNYSLPACLVFVEVCVFCFPHLNSIGWFIGCVNKKGSGDDIGFDNYAAFLTIQISFLYDGYYIDGE